jgi:hypothetical protein
MSIAKQLNINSLPIPCELQDNIKEYLFYTLEQQKIRRIFNKSLHLIKNAYYEESDGHWAYSATRHEDNPQFQAVMCNICHNYETKYLIYTLKNCGCECDDDWNYFIMS